MKSLQKKLFLLFNLLLQYLTSTLLYQVHWIEKYREIPPVNDENAPGAIAYTISEPMDTVKKTINQNYQIEDEISSKYKQINSLDERQNTGRIIGFLKQDQILYPLKN